MRLSTAQARKLGIEADVRPRSKYRNTPCWRDGYWFASILEADCYDVLKVMQARGEINYFLRQVPIHLAPAGDQKERPVLMRVDFVPVSHPDSNGRRVIRYIDAKGVATPSWKDKAAMAESKMGIKIELWER